MPLAVENRVRKICLVRAFPIVELGQRVGIGFETDQAREPRVQKGFIRRGAVDGIGPDIDHVEGHVQI